MLGEGGQIPQYKGVGEAKKAGEGAAVARDIEAGRDEKRRLYRRQLRILRPQPCDKRQEALGIGRVSGQAALRLRKDTMIDLEVGVSLSAPALPSGTSTFSSG